MCGPDDSKYVEKLAADLQPFAAKVTRTGAFVVKTESPGDGTSTIVVSLVDHGKSVFVHRISAIGALVDLEMRPGKTTSGEPGLLAVLRQGNIGECQYNVLVQRGNFVVIARGYKEFRR
jgi:hypothetical protein